MRARMPETLAQFWNELVARPEGPMAFRFYIQPLVAIGLAVRDGIKDAHEGRPAYFWALFTDRSGRRERMRDGWRAIRKVFIVSLLLDTIYQLIVLKGLTPIEGLVIAVMLAIVPYVLLRGPVNRIARRIRRSAAPHSSRLSLRRAKNLNWPAMALLELATAAARAGIVSVDVRKHHVGRRTP